MEESFNNMTKVWEPVLSLIVYHLDKKVLNEQNVLPSVGFMNLIIDHINFLRINHFKRTQKFIEGIPLEFLTKTLQFAYDKLKPLNKSSFNAWNAMVFSNLKMLILVKKGYSAKTKDSPVIF